MERMRRDRSIADLNEIKKAEQERRLVPRDQVIREGHSYSATVRDRVRALPRRFLLAGILHTEHQGEGERICDEILDELVAWAEGLAKP
jgi:hypothetical protein